MRNLEDGSTVYIRNEGNRYCVEHIAQNGITADRVECDTFFEARAVFAEHPANW